METNKEKVIMISTVVLAVIFIIYFGISSWNTGFYLDFIPPDINTEHYLLALNVGIFLSVILCIISLYGIIRNKKKIIIIIIGCIVVINSLLVVVSLVKYPDWNKLRKTDVTTNGGNINDANISEIMWNDLLSDYRSDKYTMVYIGRDNCPACQEFKPVLGEAVFEKNIFVSYYNTTLDREKNDFDQKQKMLNLESVPALVIIGNNKVIYAEEEVFSDRKALNEYLDNYQHKYE